MSKLRRQIRNLGRTAASAIGFQQTRSASRLPQVLVAVEVSNAGDARTAIEAGAHVLISASDALAAVVAAAGNLPVGVRFDAASADDIVTATAAGADFFVFDDSRTAAVALLRQDHNNPREPLGRLPLLGSDHSEERLRSLAALGADAIIVDGVSVSLTVGEQLRLRRISDLTTAPLAVSADVAPSAETLQVWRDAGAPIVLVPADAATVRSTIEAAGRVPAPQRPRDERTAILPSLGNQHNDDDDDDDS